jgi:hypothetical protein
MHGHVLNILNKLSDGYPLLYLAADAKIPNPGRQIIHKIGPIQVQELTHETFFSRTRMRAVHHCIRRRNGLKYRKNNISPHWAMLAIVCITMLAIVPHLFPLTGMAS